MSFIKNQNEPFSSLTHLIAAIFSVAALVLLIVFSVIHSTKLHVVSFSIFGASLILLYTASAIYHFISEESKAKSIFKKIDHAMIYFLIAGTYTPICLLVLRGGLGLEFIWSSLGACSIGHWLQTYR